MENIIDTKKQLYSSLGDGFKKYLQLLKLWFKGDLDKDSFDDEAVKLLSRDQIKIHNKFLISLLTKCQTLSSVKTENKGIRGPPVKKKAKIDNRFRPVSPSEFIRTTRTTADCSVDKALEYHKSVLSVTSCSGDSTLPDNFATHLRMFVVTWESGLDSLSDDSVTLINLAVRDFIKNVMTSIISFKRGFQTTHSGFKHFFGTSLFDPLLANSREVVEAEDDFVMMDSFDDSEQKAVMLTACTREEDLNDRKPLSLWDTFYALRKYRQTIPSHSLYSINLARIMTRLHDSEEYQRAQRLAN